MIRRLDQKAAKRSAVDRLLRFFVCVMLSLPAQDDVVCQILLVKFCEILRQQSLPDGKSCAIMMPNDSFFRSLL